MKTRPRQLLLVFSQFHVFSESAGFLRAGHIYTCMDTNTDHFINKTLGRALDPHANGTWLSKLTE